MATRQPAGEERGAGEQPAGDSGRAGGPEDDPTDRPVQLLPARQLVQISLYWFGLTVVWAGWEILGQERIEEFFDRTSAPAALGAMEAIAVVMAITVQPTVGAISDYTISRWGRRKPYIFVGTVLDAFLLVAIALSASAPAFFIALLGLQFSSNFAQGPFQGYVPDLVPEPQVGLASGLAGLAQVFGNIAGTVIIVGGFVLFNDYFWPTIALGLVELATMFGTVRWVREGRSARPREGKSWVAIAREAWATDVLRERDYVWLVGSRFFFLTGAGMLINTQVFYLERSLGLEGDEKAFWIGVSTVVFGLTALVVTVPSARISDRVGRKPVIWSACLMGGLGLGLVAIAPGIPLVLPGVTLLAAAAGIFLAVDWAFMTDIIPKIAAGRYMGLSNVATASATAVAPALGGAVISLTTVLFGLAAGPRFAEASGIVLFAVAALLLRPVHDRAHERAIQGTTQRPPTGYPVS